MLFRLITRSIIVILTGFIAVAVSANPQQHPVQSQTATHGAAVKHQSGMPTLMYDVLFLKQGKTMADALAYFKDVVPIIETHGIKRIHSVEIQSYPSKRQDVKPAIVQVWQLLAEDPFKAIFSDPEYLKHVERRDAIFDFANGYAWIGPDYERN